MSVLLDALKKAAEEKKKGGSPAINDSNSSGLQLKTDKDESDTQNAGQEEVLDKTQEFEDKNLTEDPSAEEGKHSMENKDSSSLSLKLSPKEPENRYKSELIEEIDDSDLPTFDSSLLNSSDSDGESVDDDLIDARRKKEQHERESSAQPLETKLRQSIDTKATPDSIDIIDVDEESLADTTASFDESILAPKLTEIDEKKHLEIQSNEINKDVEGSYDWSMDQLPGYQDSERQIEKASRNNPDSADKDAELAKNAVLTQGKNRHFQARLKRSQESLSSRVLISLMVFALFVGILFYGVVYFQQQSEALEQQFTKYNLVRIQPQNIPEESRSTDQPSEESIVASNREESLDDDSLSQEKALIGHVQDDLTASVIEKNDGVDIAGSDNAAKKENKEQSEDRIQKQPTVPKAIEKKAITASNQKIEQQKTAEPKTLSTNGKMSVESSKGISRETTLLKEAYEAYQNQRWLEAEEKFSNLNKLNPDNINAKLGFAGALLNQKKYQQAYTEYRNILKREPRNVYAIEAIASIAEQIPQNSNFHAILNEIVEQYPSSSVLQNALGNIQASKGDWFKAQKSYFNALSVEPQNPRYHLNLAVSLDHLKKYKMAVKHYKQTINYAGSDPAVNIGVITKRMSVLERYLEKGGT